MKSIIYTKTWSVILLFQSCHGFIHIFYWSGSGLWFTVFYSTFNNISVISWWSVLLQEETGVPKENHRPVASHRQTLSHNVVSN